MQRPAKPLLSQRGGGHRPRLAAADNGNNLFAHARSLQIQTGSHVPDPTDPQTGVGIDHHAAQRAVVAP